MVATHCCKLSAADSQYLLASAASIHYPGSQPQVKTCSNHCKKNKVVARGRGRARFSGGHTVVMTMKMINNTTRMSIKGVMLMSADSAAGPTTVIAIELYLVMKSYAVKKLLFSLFREQAELAHPGRAAVVPHFHHRLVLG